MSQDHEPIPVLPPEPGMPMRAPLRSTPVDPFSGRPRGPQRIIQHEVPAVFDTAARPAVAWQRRLMAEVQTAA